MKLDKIIINIFNYFFFGVFLFSIYLKINDFQGFIYKLARSEVLMPKFVTLIAYLDLFLEILLLLLLIFLPKKRLTGYLISGILLLYGIFVFYVQQYGNYCGCINLIDFGGNHSLSLAFNSVLWLFSLGYLLLIMRYDKINNK